MAAADITSGPDRTVPETVTEWAVRYERMFDGGSRIVGFGRNEEWARRALAISPPDLGETATVLRRTVTTTPWVPAGDE